MYLQLLLDDLTNLTAWKQFLLLPVLMSVFKHKDSKKVVLAKRIQLLMDKDWTQFSFHDLASPTSSTLSTTSNTHKRVTQLVKEGEYSRAMQTILFTATLTIIGLKEFEIMQTLHPTRSEHDRPLYAETVSDVSRPTIEPYLITPQETYKLMCKAFKWIAPGIDGFRNDHKRSLAGNFQNPVTSIANAIKSSLIYSDAPN